MLKLKPAKRLCDILPNKAYLLISCVTLQESAVAHYILKLKLCTLSRGVEHQLTCWTHPVHAEIQGSQLRKKKKKKKKGKNFSIMWDGAQYHSTSPVQFLGKNSPDCSQRSGLGFATAGSCDQYVQAGKWVQTVKSLIKKFKQINAAILKCDG